MALENFQGSSGVNFLNVTRETPRASVGFYAEQYGLMVASPIGKNSPVIRESSLITDGPFTPGKEAKSINASLVSVSTQKDLSNPAGTFNIELVEEGRYKNKAEFSWENIIRPNTLVWIDLQRPGLPAIYKGSPVNDFGIGSRGNPTITQENASKPQRVMVGFVDSVTTTASMSGGVPQRRISIQGRDAGKVLVNAEIKNAEAISLIGSMHGYFNIWSKDIQIGEQTVSEIVKDYWENKLFSTRSFSTAVTFGDGLINFFVGPTKNSINIKELFKYQLATADAKVFAFEGMQELSWDGNYFNLFKKLIGVPFFEIFIDSRFDDNVIWESDRKAPWYYDNLNKTDKTGAKNPQKQSGKAYTFPSDLLGSDTPAYSTLFVRPAPWPWRGDKNISKIGEGKDSKIIKHMASQHNNDWGVTVPDNSGVERWKSLLIHEVHEEDIISYTKTRTDLDVFNWFWCQDRFLAYIEQANGSADGSISSWGKNIQYWLNPPLAYPGLVKRYGLKFMETDVPFINMDNFAYFAWRYTRILADYYCFNWLFWSGSITVKGNPNIRVGDKLFVWADSRIYYIEGVTHNFQQFGQYTTTVTITRGTKYNWFEDNKRFFSLDKLTGSKVVDFDATEQGVEKLMKEIANVKK